MPGDVATVRGLIIAAIDALDGWTPSRFAPELFGRDTDRLLHHSFAVGVPSTEPKDGRQSLTDGCLVISTVEVQWAHRLRGDAQSGDYDDATDAEQALVQAVVGISTQHVLIQRLTRRAAAEGWVIGTATFQVIHRYALA
jgi:hypothetical protein